MERDNRMNTDSDVFTNTLNLSPSSYTCLENLQWLKDNSGWSWDECSKRGLLREDPGTVFGEFIDDIDEAILYSNLVPYEWSDELAHSASMLLEDMDGCNLNPDQIVDDQTSRYYIDMIAKYDDH